MNLHSETGTGERIEIRGFGSFTITHRQPRLGRNPRSGEAVQVPAKRVTHFKPGKALRESVDDPSNILTSTASPKNNDE